jgi:hypothetical protein
MLKLTLTLLLAAQQQAAAPALPGDTVYASPAIADIVNRAAALNAQVPAGLESYRARVETELSFVRAEPDGRETTSSSSRWPATCTGAADGGVLQQLLGYRSQTLGASFSGLSFFDVPWIVPILYGERIDLVRTGGPAYAEGGALLRRRALHPFAATREDVYRFAGGDTVDIIVLPARRIPIVRIHVEPRATPRLPTLLFHGDIDLDVTRMHIVRMQGRLIPSGRAAQRPRLHRAGRPLRQLRDRRVRRGLLAAAHAAVRGAGAVPPRRGARAVPRHLALRRHPHQRPGRAAPRARSAAAPVRPHGRRRRFRRSRPLRRLARRPRRPQHRSRCPRLRRLRSARAAPTGAPRLAFGARSFRQLLRFNTAEGAFTGAGLVFDFGDAAPGLSLRAHGGYAWAEGAWRGGAEIAQRARGWEFIGRGERQLAHTNDFTWGLDPEPGVPPMLAADQYDFLRPPHRRPRRPHHRSEGAALRLEAARAADRNVGRNVMPFPDDDPQAEPPPTHFGNTRLNRPILPGDYWLGRAELRLNPSAGGISLHPGPALRLAWEGATGDLDGTASRPAPPCDACTVVSPSPSAPTPA